MKNIYLIAILFLCSCARGMDSELAAYAEEFAIQATYETGIRVEAVDMSFVDIIDDNQVFKGSCDYFANYRHIRINKNKWAEINEKRRKALVYHEQGHCVFKLEHTKKHGIMSLDVPIVVYEEHFKDYWAHVKEGLK